MSEKLWLRKIVTFSKKKYDPYTRRISEITVSEESD